MFLISEIKKSWKIIINPEEFYDIERDKSSYIRILKYYSIILIIVSVLTPIMNYLGFPSNIIHAGTNAQMGAYQTAPLLEDITGISRYIWVGLLTYLGNLIKFPVIGFIFYLFNLILKGKGPLIHSFKIGIYSAAPVLLFGWVPYFALISGMWPGYLYVIGYHKLYNIKFGKTIALINFMIGIQIVYALVFGWLINPTPW